MSWLETVPVDWTRKGPSDLSDLLCTHYPRWEDAHALAQRAGMVPGTFPDHGSMKTTWHAAINALANQAKLHTLVVEASLEYGEFSALLE